MGRAGWGVITMTLIALAVAISGLIQGDSLSSVVEQNPTIDQLYNHDEVNYSLTNTDSFENTFYGYVEGEDDITATSEDYYSSSWVNTKGVLRFLKDFIAPATILNQIPSLTLYPAKLIVWVVNVIWGILYALLLFEIIWRFNIFD